jgi:integrase
MDISSQETEKEIQKRINELKKQLPKKTRKPKRLPVAISEKEFDSLLKATKLKHHKLAFLLGYASGLRISEVIHLERRHFDLNKKVILIEQGKGGKDRTVPLPKGFQENYLKLLPMPCGKRALEKAFKSTAKRTGLLEIKPTLHFHSLRHGFATTNVSKGMAIHHLRTLMGHSNISTTNVYLEANPREALKSYEDLF